MQLASNFCPCSRLDIGVWIYLLALKAVLGVTLSFTSLTATVLDISSLNLTVPLHCPVLTWPGCPCFLCIVLSPGIFGAGTSFCFKWTGNILPKYFLDSWSVCQCFQAVVQKEFGVSGRTFGDFRFYCQSAVPWAWIKRGCNSTGQADVLCLCWRGDSVALGVEGSAILVIGLFGDLQQIGSAFSPLRSFLPCLCWWWLPSSEQSGIESKA